MAEVPVAVERAALAAVDRIGGDERLRADVLAELHAPDRNADRYVDVVAVASLIVAAATLAWTIYQNRRDNRSSANREVVARQIRVALSETGGVPTQQRDLVIEVVVDKIITEGENR
ncbi:hypothetical protein [Verrucosispora sp. WMMD573]|uniref:hypothetical protein n=1 Tax=Verrucosispora sp. WMMD573 TaxID=3015149 RepID=UPI00248CDC20|nr:hypothetical protein [Verrucosispora sp. WMMD573]WBB52005.1 hypothetical protein O7601_15380 [Verrucosispora sp. WMMD573]